MCADFFYSDFISVITVVEFFSEAGDFQLFFNIPIIIFKHTHYQEDLINISA